jgi:hypothetical protein
MVLTEEQQRRLANLIKNPTIRCIGQYLIVLPENFFASNGLVIIDKQRIERKREYLSVFEQHIEQRKEKLKNHFIKKIYLILKIFIHCLMKYCGSKITKERNNYGMAYPRNSRIRCFTSTPLWRVVKYFSCNVDYWPAVSVIYR